MEIPYIIMLNEKMQGSKLYVQDAMHYFKRLRKHTTMLILSVNGGFTKDLFSYLYYSVFFFFFLAISPYVLIVRKKIHKIYLKVLRIPPFQGHAVCLQYLSTKDSTSREHGRWTEARCLS